MDALIGYHQIVGHTKFKEITTIPKGEDTSITFIDVIDKPYILNL